VNLVSLLDEASASFGDEIALVRTEHGRELPTSHHELAQRAARTAPLFSRRGVGAGDAVLVLVPMSERLYVVLFALWRLGALPMFLDPSAGREHVERCCALLSPKAFVGSRRAHALRLESAALRHVPLLFATGGGVPGATSLGEADREQALATVAGLDDDTPALVTFTSGSTGAPKAAVRTHGFLAAQHEVLARHIGLEPGQVDLATLPVFAMANLASRVTSVLPDADLRRVGDVDAGPVVAQIRRAGVDRTGASPAFLDRVARHCERTGTALPGLERIHVGGAPVFPRLLERLAAVAPNARVVAVYGSTEAEPVAHIAWNDITAADLEEMRAGAGLLAGVPIPEIDLRVIPARPGEPIGPFEPEEFEALALPANAPGEIVVSGPHVLGGYLGGRGDEETKFDVGARRWHRMGDAGRLDPGGRLWLLGRVGARVSDDRGEIWPFAVECAVSGEPGVARTALVARGGRRVLVVQGEADAPPDLAALRTLLDWAGLDDVHVTRHIPVDARHNAKVDYPALGRLLERELPRG
jgi:acyl-CoA synthetase (AMP-forming)/AMP-acid ligase II